MADGFVIETADLRKRYDGVEALRGLTLAVPAGSICGFLGRTGAGKTTTIKILLGMARPTAGRATRVRPAGRLARRRASRSGAAPGSSATTRGSTTR